MGRVFQSVVTALVLAVPSFSVAASQDLYWDRLDQLMQRDGWVMVSSSDVHRRIKCETCADDVIVTISVSTPSASITDTYTISQAIEAYRTNKCRKLVQTGEGRCIRPGFAQIKGNLAELEMVMPYGQDIIWGHATWPSGAAHPEALSGDWIRQLMKSLTPLY